MDLSNVLKRCAPSWDGGYVICGLTGSGESFTVRDPWGIRPAFYYKDDEIVIVASERPVIQTAMNVPVEDVKELNRGEALIINKAGEFRTSQIIAPKENKACSFERIYFSRGSDKDIYQERKRLGKNLVPAILKAIDNDLNHTVFSFIPNTAEVAYFGMLEGLNEYLNGLKKEWIADRKHLLQENELERILSMRVRSEKVAIKDIKLRTFIAEGNSRNDLAAHAKEVEMDAVAKEGEIIAYAISEHIEFAGVHSGDATIQFPAQKLYVETVRRIKRISKQIAKELNISGPFNIQYLAKGNEIKVIECNLRASRSFPFVSKVLKINLIELATRIMNSCRILMRSVI